MKTTTDDGLRLLNPPHPGDFIRTELLDAYDLTVAAGAKVLGVSRPALSNLVNERANVSGDMALRIEKAFGFPMDTLLRMQNSYDIAQARAREKLIHVRRYKKVA